jgi:hypothetical protein
MSSLTLDQRFNFMAAEAIGLAETRGTVKEKHLTKATDYNTAVLALEAFKESLKGAKNPVGERKLSKVIMTTLAKLEGERAETIDDCRTIYRKAFQPATASASSPVFVLGGDCLRTSDKDAVEIMQNFGVLSGVRHAAPAAVATHRWPRADHASGAFVLDRMDLSTGGVLNDGSWSVFKNDCAMLGVIHSGRTCYVANLRSPKTLATFKADLWDSAKGRPRVLGREIAMLYAAGYRQVTEDSLVEKCGYTFVALDKARASTITLKALMESADSLSSEAELLSMLAFYPDPSAHEAVEDAALMRAAIDPATLEAGIDDLSTITGSPLSMITISSGSVSPEQLIIWEELSKKSAAFAFDLENMSPILSKNPAKGGAACRPEFHRLKERLPLEPLALKMGSAAAAGGAGGSGLAKFAKPLAEEE